MIYRVERENNPYVMVDKGFINDINIGFKEKGILLYFLSKPADWKFYEGEITAHSHDGLTAVRTGIQSLIDNGYIERRQLKDGTKFAGYEYVVHETSSLCKLADEETPFSENPITGIPKTDIPISENHTLLSNNSTNNDVSKNDVNTSPISPKGNEERKESQSELMGRFEIFYKAYPRHKSRGDAEKAWRSIKPDKVLFAKIMESLEIAKQNPDWQKENHKYAPYPASWLRAKGWEDDQDADSSAFKTNTNEKMGWGGYLC